MFCDCVLSALFCVFQCRDFVKAGAEQGQTPSDVILAADITFSCVADPQAAKDVIFFCYSQNLRFLVVGRGDGSVVVVIIVIPLLKSK
jgi:hypothetical protein